MENQSYLHDAVGNVTQRQQNNLGLTENFYYDSLNRLSNSTLANASGTSTNLQMCYDNTGGGCSDNLPGPGAVTSKTPDSITPVSYAATWTSYNYLASFTTGAESVQFQYGPDRSRWQQVYTNGSNTTETTTYIGGNLERVVLSSGVTTYRAYVYAGSEPVAVQNQGAAGNTWSYMLPDHQGSVASLLDSSGHSTVSESFTAYGVRRDPSTWSGAASSTDLTTSAGITRQGYTFQTVLGAAMGLNHMNGRVQDAITGQFLSPDPTIPDPTNTQSYNRYAYVNNNPLTMVDPTGFDDKSCPTQEGPCGGGTERSWPGRWSWSCYGNCGTQGGWANSIMTTVPIPPGASLSGFVGFLGDASPSLDSSSAPASSPQGSLSEVVVTAAQQSQEAQLGPPGVSPDGETVTVCGNCTSAAGDLIYKWLVQPTFGWIDCAGGRCSSGQELWRMTGPIRMAAGGFAGKAIVASLAVRSASAGLQATLVATMMQGSPDALVSIAQSLDLEGVELVESLVQQAPALEPLIERVAEAAEALAESAGP